MRSRKKKMVYFRICSCCGEIVRLRTTEEIECALVDDALCMMSKVDYKRYLRERASKGVGQMESRTVGGKNE